MLRRLLAGSSHISSFGWLLALLLGCSGVVCLVWGVQIFEIGWDGFDLRITVCVCVAALTYARLLINNTRGTCSSLSMSQGAFRRYKQAADAKRTQLARYGLTPSSALLSVYSDACIQFISRAKDFFTRSFRPLQPLLNLVADGLFFVGLVFAPVKVWRRRECWIAINGLLTLILPAAMAFSLDCVEKHALAQRLVGATFFLT
jgi:hypothetical protein